MKLERLPYDSATVLDFYEEGLGALGAVCERPWFDRLEVLAEGSAARLWNAEGSLYSGEIHFALADASKARDAEREVFPGCPLTFRLAETLLGSTAGLTLERFVLASDSGAHPPDPALAEKRWRSEDAHARKWRLASPFKADFHFSLLALVRCEIQAIDQHWSMRRIVLSLPGGQLDDHLASEIAFARADRTLASQPNWPKPDPAQWSNLLRLALEQDLASDLATLRARQEASLRRELDRIDGYFENYARELADRSRRSSTESGKVKGADRLAAANAEHARRRADQIARHEMRVHPRFDALLLVAETAWRAQVEVQHEHRLETIDSVFVPRLRRWMPPGSASELLAAKTPESA